MKALFFAATAAMLCASSFAGELHVNQGRFELLQLGEFRRDQFLLDSQTGRVWQKVCIAHEANPKDAEHPECTGYMFEEQAVEHLPASKAKVAP